jgi:hypothetical protein
MAELARRIKRIKNQLCINEDWLSKHHCENMQTERISGIDRNKEEKEASTEFLDSRRPSLEYLELQIQSFLEHANKSSDEVSSLPSRIEKAMNICLSIQCMDELLATLPPAPQNQWWIARLLNVRATLFDFLRQV